jgi:gamma-glutamylcyclotransferase (GGCT)/AIG2-like uncharacterized protein YtfP
MLPFFVYGTLRPGESNYHLLQGQTLSEQSAHVRGLCLYSLGTYPMMVKSTNPDERVWGELVVIKPQAYPQVVKHLDELEEYDPANPLSSLYQRITYPIHLDGGETVTAWLYIGQHEVIKLSDPRIWDGDWVRFRREHDIGDFMGINGG